MLYIILIWTGKGLARNVKLHPTLVYGYTVQDVVDEFTFFDGREVGELKQLPNKTDRWYTVDGDGEVKYEFIQAA